MSACWESQRSAVICEPGRKCFILFHCHFRGHKTLHDKPSRGKETFLSDLSMNLNGPKKSVFLGSQPLKLTLTLKITTVGAFISSIILSGIDKLKHHEQNNIHNLISCILRNINSPNIMAVYRRNKKINKIKKYIWKILNHGGIYCVFWSCFFYFCGRFSSLSVFANNTAWYFHYIPLWVTRKVFFYKFYTFSANS